MELNLNTVNPIEKINNISKYYNLSFNESIEIAKIIYGEKNTKNKGNPTLKFIVEMGIVNIKAVTNIKSIIFKEQLKKFIEEYSGQ